MAATGSSATVVRATPFLGQTKYANPLRDIVPMGSARFTMVTFYFSFKCFYN